MIELDNLRALTERHFGMTLWEILSSPLTSNLKYYKALIASPVLYEVVTKISLADVAQNSEAKMAAVKTIKLYLYLSVVIYMHIW